MLIKYDATKSYETSFISSIEIELSYASKELVQELVTFFLLKWIKTKTTSEEL